MKSRWDSLVNRIRQEALDTLKNNRSDGVSIVTAHVIVTSKGEPLLWVVPSGKRVEPTADAAEIIRQLLI